jgi:hypothetical protein
MAPPCLARSGPLAGDARLTALGVLLAHPGPGEASREDVAALAGWLAGPDRALPSAALRAKDRAEWAAPGVREAEAAMSAAAPGALADRLLTECAEGAVAE